MAFDVLSIPKRFYRTLSNLRTGIILLILVGIAAALGTFILQRPATEPEKMAQAYSPELLRWLDRLMLTDVFHAWWFTTLLALLSLSIISVSVDRFPNAWRFYARPYRKPDSHFRAVLPNRREFAVKNAAAAMNAVERVLRRLHWPVEQITEDGERSLYSEKHRFSVMAVYVVHASLLLIFAGGIVDATLGYNGFVSLEPGQQKNQIELRTGGIKALPFSVRCDAAGQENYPDGSPKRWWSKLAVVQDGKQVAAKEIVVNDPLVYKGLRFYQASFGPTGSLAGLKVLAKPQAGEGSEVTLAMNQPVDLDANTSVTLAEYIPDFYIQDNQVYKRSDNPQNPAFRLEIKDKVSGAEAKQWLFPAYDETSQGQKANYTFAYREMKMGYFTGLQVSHEPGQWLVWAGCLLMGCGLFVAFYMVHMRIWVVALPGSNGRPMLWVGGSANKNRDRFEQKYQELVEEIEKELGPIIESPRAGGRGAKTELTLVSSR